MSSLIKKRNFIVINKGFICVNCGEKNPCAQKTCRNHCRKCLHSYHADQNSPGDRQSDCEGLMIPLSIESNPKKGYIIVHRCQKCQKITRNKTALDDDFEKIVRIAVSKL